MVLDDSAADGELEGGLVVGGVFGGLFDEGLEDLVLWWASEDGAHTVSGVLAWVRRNEGEVWRRDGHTIMFWFHSAVSSCL